MNQSARLAAMVAAAVVLAACAARGPASRSEPAQLEIENRGFPDMVVYVVDGSRRIRLGTAIGNTTAKLRIPTSVIATGREVQFLADPVGSDRAGVSERIFVRPGQVVRLMIPP